MELCFTATSSLTGGAGLTPSLVPRTLTTMAMPSLVGTKHGLTVFSKISLQLKYSSMSGIVISLHGFASAKAVSSLGHPLSATTVTFY